MTDGGGQVWNGDEIGFDPTGQWNRTLCFSFNRPGHTITPDERAPFWASVFYWSRGDGVLGMIPPTIIHQGEAEVVTYANVSTGQCDTEGQLLCLPASWLVHQSPSGYNDRVGFRKIAMHFLAHCGPRRPQYVFVDGHDSHWDPDALQLLKDAQVFVFFLRSQNSENDQPNDNGPNAALKAKYKESLEQWYWRWTRSVKLTPAYFNSIFLSAWQLFVCDAGGAVVRAFARCGLHPLNPELAVLEEEKRDYGSMFALGAQGVEAVRTVAAKGEGEGAGGVQVQREDAPADTIFSAGSHPKKVVLRAAVYDTLAKRVKQVRLLCSALLCSALLSLTRVCRHRS